MNKTLIAVIVIIVIALGGWLYFSKSAAAPTDSMENMTSQAPATDTGTQPATTDASMQTGPVKEFTVTGQNFSFSPSTLSVKKGDHVKITFTSGGGLHDFVIDEFNAKTSRIGTGASAVVEFTADKAGSFEYYCSVGSHRAMGMKGTLTVTE